jgi:hypothetical protein
LTVVVPPSIVTQPINQTVAAGASAAFQVSAAGSSPLTYQWMGNGSPLVGATASSLVLNKVQTNQAGGYCAIITNAAGSITSVLANLTVLVPPSSRSCRPTKPSWWAAMSLSNPALPAPLH